jgi:hypothetical protein
MNILNIDNKVLCIALSCLVILISLTSGKPVTFVFVGVAIVLCLVKAATAIFR